MRRVHDVAVLAVTLAAIFAAVFITPDHSLNSLLIFTLGSIVGVGVAWRKR